MDELVKKLSTTNRSLLGASHSRSVFQMLSVKIELESENYKFSIFLPRDKNPTSINLASMMIRGRRKQKEDTRCMNDDVGPP